jgi:S-DNA-T family DNA segregation ATPase FtsK/SpoIIIE
MATAPSPHLSSWRSLPKIRSNSADRVSAGDPVLTPDIGMSKSTSSTKPETKAKAKATKTPEPRRRQLRYSVGVRGREIAGVLLIALAVLSLLALSNLTRGSLSDWWSTGLYRLFGWGAFLFAIMLGAIGVLIIARTQNIVLVTPWKSIIAIEVAFFAFLPVLTAFGAFEDKNMWSMITAGNGGGVVGWGLLMIVAPIFPRYSAGLFYLAITIVALTMGLRLPWLTWYARLKIWLVRRRPIETVATPTANAAGPLSSARPIEEEMVPPQAVIIKAKSLDQRPVQATQLPLKIVKAEAVPPPPRIKKERVLPALDLLEGHTSDSIAKEEIERKKEVIEKTLQQFGLEAKVVRTAQGPAVTQYGVEPGYIERPGVDGEVRRQKVRVAQISSLQNDLALALAAPSLRIEAPVPGQSFVGIEVPNDAVELVGLRGVLESEAFGKLKAKAPMAFALGQDVSGTAIAADLASMPHILIAGTTGSGKSVCINAVIMSLIMDNTPDDLRIVMIDPKMVELIRYNGLPHLYGKVETEVERIVGVLRWVTREMDSRYKKFSDLGVRHVNEYNERMIEKGSDKLPHMAVFIDELSDLMMSAPVEVEKTICRIAQMARATGIHLVIATQRPSTDVVTGLIKANFPARIAFAVASGVDSRVILDGVGAETLLGKGDMLFLSPTANGAVRVQGCYVGEREIDRVADFWREQYADEERVPAPWEITKTQHLEEIAQAGAATAALEDDDEVLLAKAIELVKKNRQASASWLQRKMRLGYPKAAYLIDRMEQMGIVGPVQEAGRARDVLIGPNDEFDGLM